MNTYKHTIQYYETDRMGITHHSNYIRWMEEARIDFLKQLGWGYERMEAEGIISPVTAIEGQFKAATTFPEVVEINVFVSEFKGVVLRLDYRMTGEDGRLVFTGHSEHCFMNREGKLIRVKRDYPDLYALLASQVRTDLAPAGPGRTRR